MLFPTLGPSSLPVVVAQPDKSHTNYKQNSFCVGVIWQICIKPSISGSNEVVVVTTSYVFSSWLLFNCYVIFVFYALLCGSSTLIKSLLQEKLILHAINLKGHFRNGYDAFSFWSK